MKVCAVLLSVALSLAVHTEAKGIQSTTSSQAGAQSSNIAFAPINVPVETAFLARLGTILLLRQCKPGDSIEAEVRQDVKSGSAVLVQKGSMLLGHVAGVQLSPDPTHLEVAVVFDSVRLKGDKQFSLHVVIQALAPEANVDDNRSLAESPLRRWSGHSTTIKAGVNPLTTNSKGIYDLRALQLAEQITNGTHYSVLTASTKDIKLKSGTQLVMKVVSQ